MIRAAARQERDHQAHPRRRRRRQASAIRSRSPPLKRLRLLVLGGTSEASALARRLAGNEAFDPVLSLAGATSSRAPSPIPVIVGGFGGVEGLAAFLSREGVDAVVDATHPFAERMSRNAALAAGATGKPLVVFTRGPWTPAPGDRWTEVVTLEAAVGALGLERRCVFLTQGRLGLTAFAAAPQHRYVVRAIDPPAEFDALSDARLILARGPFALDDELRLMREEDIEILVTKNSGGGATYPKIEAARMLGIEVLMVRRPKAPEAETLHDLEAVMRWLAAHRPAP